MWKNLWNILWYSFHMPKKKSKIIQVPMPEELVESLDRLSYERGESRAFVIREAAAKYVARAEDAEKARRYIEGYEKFPEDEEEIGLAEASTRELSKRLAQDEW